MECIVRRVQVGTTVAGDRSTAGRAESWHELQRRLFPRLTILAKLVPPGGQPVVGSKDGSHCIVRAIRVDDDGNPVVL